MINAIMALLASPLVDIGLAGIIAAVMYINYREGR